MKHAPIRLLRLAATGVGVIALLCLLGWAVCPDMTGRPRELPPLERAELAALRDNRIDPAKPLQIPVDVDYAEASRADWWPKGEAPILADLVKAGKLPPVGQRVGPEPLVVRGVDGPGTYGGVWVRAVPDVPAGVFTTCYELRYGTFLRFGPHGSTHNCLARKIEVSDDNRVFTVRLRKVRWSDGHPLTADDVMFWWNDWARWERVTWEEPPDEAAGKPGRGKRVERIGWIPEIVKIRGQTAVVEKLDEQTVRYTFPEPNGIFLEFMTGARGAAYTPTPKHYLQQFHPEYGNRDLIEKMKEAYGLASDRDVFNFANSPDNPDRPQLGPWLLQRYTTAGPLILVRNPWFWVVDTRGNQLPYLDAVVYDVKKDQMLDMSVITGNTSVQVATYPNYSQLMSQRKMRGYEVYHWLSDARSECSIAPNLNLLVDPDDPASRLKHGLLNDLRFRRALSFAIDRRQIIDAEWNGAVRPSHLHPGPESLYHYPDLDAKFEEYLRHDPGRANRILDEIGLTRRDLSGFRTFADGTPMTFFLNVSTGSRLTGVAQFVARDWARAGVRVIPRERGDALFNTEKFARKPDFMMMGPSGGLQALSGGGYTPENAHNLWATAWGTWFWAGGLQGHPRSKETDCVEPPMGHPIREAMAIYEQASTVLDPAKRKPVFKPAVEIFAENLWTIGIAEPPPILVVVKDGMKNVPRTAVWGFIDTMNFNCAYPETWYWEGEPRYAYIDPEGIKDHLLNPVRRPKRQPVDTTAAGASGGAPGAGAATAAAHAGRLASGLAALCLLGLIAWRQPYVGRRLLIMVPTLAIISVIVFTVIQLPPGDYLSTYIQQLQQQGVEVSGAEIADLEQTFHLNEPLWEQYCSWVGLKWFVTLRENDKGMLQGDLGMSMQHRKPVNDIIGDRILLTFLISLGTVLLTWAIAIPIGIYSAARQYTATDYILTFVGFIGICIPQFLLALVLMYFADRWFGIQVSGLFSPGYATAPWSWARFVDLLKHMWLPVVILGVGGTAGMIRVMRANLLDELKKPYVVTARAKGMRPVKLLLKYPVRIALNPFVSGIGGLFPSLVSGGAIVAMVLSLPTVGPLMLEALKSEDMYLAGSMLMVLSVLSVVGVLVSDLMLLWLDPRIRFGGRGR